MHTDERSTNFFHLHHRKDTSSCVYPQLSPPAPTSGSAHSSTSCTHHLTQLIRTPPNTSRTHPPVWTEKGTAARSPNEHNTPPVHPHTRLDWRSTPRTAHRTSTHSHHRTAEPRNTTPLTPCTRRRHTHPRSTRTPTTSTNLTPRRPGHMAQGETDPHRHSPLNSAPAENRTPWDTRAGQPAPTSCSR